MNRTIDHHGVLEESRRDPALIEREVIELRDDCQRLIHELERRYDRVASVPRRVRERTLRVERAAARFGREHWIALAAGTLALAAGALLLRRGLRRRPPIVVLVDDAKRWLHPLRERLPDRAGWIVR